MPAVAATTTPTIRNTKNQPPDKGKVMIASDMNFAACGEPKIAHV